MSTSITKSRPFGSSAASSSSRIDKQADDLVAYDTAYAAGLAAERAKVEAERARTEKAIADFAARADAELEAERARTEKAIAAFAALAERLDALAEERSRPWWRRLASG